MNKRTRKISKFERRTSTNILGKSNSPCVKRTPQQTKRKQPSNFGIVNDEVKKLRIFYGNLRHGMMKKIYQQAGLKKDGSITDNILDILERRLCTVVFRMRFAKHQIAARQLVSHGHILVNNKVVNIASYSVRQGDVISLHPSMWNNIQITEALSSSILPSPAHLEFNAENFSCIFKSKPLLAEVSYTFNPNYPAIVEKFSR